MYPQDIDFFHVKNEFITQKLHVLLYSLFMSDNLNSLVVFPRRSMII